MYSVDNLLHQEFRPSAASAFRFPFVSHGDPQNNFNFLKSSLPTEKRKRVAVIQRSEDTDSEDEIVKEKEMAKAKAKIHADEEEREDQDSRDSKNLSETFVAVIAQSILSVPTKRMTLSSIYNFIAKTYPHFDKEKGPGWRNSVRHNLSSNDCFVKASRAENGKGHYWMIHPKDLPEFSKGNFRRPRKPRRPRCSHSLGCLSERTMIASALGSGYCSPYATKHPEFEYSLPLLAGSPDMYPRPYGLSPLTPRYDDSLSLAGYPGFPPTSAAYVGFSWPTESSAFRNYAAAALAAPPFYPYVIMPSVTGDSSTRSTSTDPQKIKDE